MPPVITFLPNGGEPEKSDGTQIFEEGVDRRQARDEKAQGWYAEERPFGQEGQEPQTGDCDRTVGGEGQGQESAEEGFEETQDFEENKETEGEEVKAKPQAVGRLAQQTPSWPGQARP
ncbi:hypothetical protein V1279_005391 [Bradyrhizobium sp. AZCC 1610]|uniref:hypothetical protein n=1 Tax=Bradyrhizobium sp. AZCC 1610 TaxID=3117020 RepID=UPI003051E13F